MSVLDMWTVCDRCGFDYKRRDCRKESTGNVVCKSCYDGAFDIKNHPQNKPARRMREQRVIPNARDDVSASLPVPEIVRVIPIGDYASSAITTAGDFPINVSLGGGYTRFTGHRVHNDNATWSPSWLFDETITVFDWASHFSIVEGPFFGQFQFPRPLKIRRIFLTPRVQGSGFPDSVAVLADGVTVAVASATSTISQADGLGMSYSGVGIKVSVSVSCSVLRLEFLSEGDCFIGELEIWAEETTVWTPYMSVGY